MATVVNLQKDTRAGDLGKGVASFLNRMADRRIDGLQQELMQGISNSENEAEAAALIADKRFIEVSSDNTRLSAVVNHLNNTPLGLESIIGYDENGSQQIIAFREGTDPAEALKNANATLEKSDLKFLIDETNPFSIPKNLGRFVNNTEATDSIDRELGVGESVMGSESMKTFISLRETSQSARVRDFRTELAQLQFNLDKNKPLTTFDAVQQAVDEGRLSKEEGQQAWDKITFKAGLTPDDVASSTIEDLDVESANIRALSERAITLAKLALAEPALLSTIGGIPRTFNAIKAEFRAAGSLLGIVEGTTIDLADFDSFSARSTAFRYSMLQFTIDFAMSKKQKGRDLSDKDFERFHKVTGANLSDPNVFGANMKELVTTLQTGFSSRYKSLQKREFTSTNDPFPRFSSKTTEEENEETRVNIEDETGVPLHRPSTTVGGN